jgi:serine/threonine protein kinase
MVLPASDLVHIIEDADDWEVCKPIDNLHASYTILLDFVNMVCKQKALPLIPTANAISDCVAFSYQVIRDATKNFDPTISKIGEGSFGTVFKAIINHQGRDHEVAIKRLSYDGFHTPAMNEEFKQEIWRVSTVRHKNIVSLLGYCLPEVRYKSIVPLLVYCPPEAKSPLLMVTPLHSSLFKHLYEGEKPWLNWQARFKIAMGVAEGLAYLHDGAPERLIHCDIKTGNILFDPNTFQAYIADFGTARFMQRSESMVGTSTLTGTRGFMDPHFQRYMMRSVMVDVYSFGVLLFVLVSGEQDVVHLLELAKDEDVVDEEFINQDDFSYNNLEIRRVLAVARQCTKFEPSDRPTMSKVTMMLNGDHPSESLSSFVVHKNIISPFGYNIKQVDFLSQMATPRYLYLSERLSQLNWEQRLNIAIGVAEALAYLHDNAPQCVVHGNINSGCIVFDPNTSQAYITEFEFAKCMQRSESEIQVSTSTGRQGYIDPHFQRYLQLSPKVDVYSFGILLCFLVSNEQNIVHLIDRVKTTNVVDVFLKHDRTYKAHEVHRMLAIARKCIKFEPTKRPPMSRIVTMLRSIHLSSFQLALLKLLPS